MKVGRNDPCWCGSGIKFKKCHLGREAEKPLPSWELSNQFRKAFSKRLCSAPAAMHGDCSGQIVKAHTVPRSGSLAKIAENGHVYAFVPSLENLIKHNGELHPQLVGINRASTFTGFCSVHDDKLFAPIEKASFASSPEQCFLLGYRAYAREIFTKTAAADAAKDHKQLDRGRSVQDQILIQATAGAYEEGLQAALKDIQHHKPRFEQPLVAGDYSNVRAYILALVDPPPVMCSATFAPEQDFGGNVLQDLVDLSGIPHLISVTSFFGGSHGHVVLSWLPEDDPVCIPFARSLDAVSDNEMSSALVRLMFEFIENVHIAPAWWDALTPQH
jgi:hypothetical protein